MSKDVLDNTVSVLEAQGIVTDLLQRLGGKQGREWLVATKRFLRKENPWTDAMMGVSVEELNLIDDQNVTVWTRDSLKSLGLKYVEQLACLSTSDLLLLKRYRSDHKCQIRQEIDFLLGKFDLMLAQGQDGLNYSQRLGMFDRRLSTSK